MLIRHLTLLLSLTAFSFSTIAQNGGYSLFRSFTVADGLPTNHIYTSVEDDHGFLWVATDAGIARFDGKHFQVFTVKNGLPDNDVLDVVKENDGRIWVNCFRQTPAYFDEVENRFINASKDTGLARVSGTTIMYLRALPEGGVMYINEKGSFIFKDKKLVKIFYIRDGLGALITTSENNLLFFGLSNDNKLLLLYSVFNNKITDSVVITDYLKINSHYIYKIDKNKFYISNASAGVFCIFSKFEMTPLRFKIDTINIREPVFWLGFTKDYFNVLSSKGNIRVFDKENLELKFVLNGNYSPNALYNDSRENIWISTVDKGLLLYKKSKVEIYAMPDNFSGTSFLSIAKTKNASLLAGNYTGQVIETDGKYFIVHQITTNQKTSWQRKIIVSQNKVFSFSEGGNMVDYNKKLLNNYGLVVSSKTATVLNDSIVIMGNYGTISKLNTITEKIIHLPSLKKRVTALAAYKDNFIYHGSTDGLYKYDIIENKDFALASNHSLFSERVTALSVSADDFIWVGTASNGVFVFRNDSVVNVFGEVKGLISNSVNCISRGRPGEVWVGTNSGISIIKYKSTPLQFTYQNITINDGLNSNIINEMIYSNDSIWCATGNGLCAIPAGINIPGFDIPVRLINLTVNGRNNIVSNNYSLKYNENNIALQVAGIEAGGHFNYFQYRINNSDWISLDVNILSLQLNSGNYKIEIRAIDVNGNAGTKPLLISFTIATPFWKAIWFWLIVMFFAGSLLVGILRKREMAKREMTLQEMLNQKKLTELELQALKSQINPHFIFNCLNSIKLLNHQQKHDEAEKYLDRFALLLRAAMEQSSIQQITLQQEIEFIENYLSLEKLRFPGKLSYTIETADTLDPGKILIPSMLLQPYIENAVKHGITPLKNRQGIVQVRFYEKNNLLIAEVQDNGKGIEREEKNIGRTGIGMANTERRSMLYKIETIIKDLSTADEEHSGTLIQLTIPLQKSST